MFKKSAGYIIYLETEAQPIESDTAKAAYTFNPHARTVGAI